MSAPLRIPVGGGPVATTPWQPGNEAPSRALVLRRGKKGPARLYVRPEAPTMRPEGPISVEGSGVHVANNHNARLQRDMPLLVHAGLVPLMTLREGRERAESIRDNAQRADQERRERAIDGDAASATAFVAEFPAVGLRAVQLARHLYPRGYLPGVLPRWARKLRVGRMPVELVDARYWMPRCEAVARGEGGAPILGLRYWQGHVEVVGSAWDPEARQRLRDTCTAELALVDACGRTTEDPLRIRRCRGIRRSHLLVLRHLLDRSPLPQPASTGGGGHVH